MSARFAAQVLGFGIGMLLSFPANLHAAQLGKAAERGKIILQEKCGRCHAIEAVGESPLKNAPPMRDTRKCRRSNFPTKTSTRS